MQHRRDANYSAGNKLKMKSKRLTSHLHFFNNYKLPKCKRSTSHLHLDNINFLIPKCKRSQMHIQEMAFMLVAVIFLFTLVGLFVFAILFSQIKGEADRIAMEKTMSAIKNLANSPEFYCVGSRPNCVDSDKAMALMTNKNYEKFWPFSRLEILKSSAFKKKESEIILCTMQNYPDCDRILIFQKNVKNRITASSYVGICRNELELGVNYQRCEIAKLIAETELIEDKK